MSTLESTEISTLDRTIIQLKSIENEVNNYICDNLIDLVENFILGEIKNLARASNLPDKFISGLKIIRVDKYTVKIINTWGTNEKPLALWFNNGTKNHFIMPKGDWALHWKDENGKDIYSKGHNIKGLPSSHVMENGINLGIQKLEKSLDNNIKKHLANKIGIN